MGQNLSSEEFYEDIQKRRGKEFEDGLRTFVSSLSSIVPEQDRLYQAEIKLAHYEVSM